MEVSGDNAETMPIDVTLAAEPSGSMEIEASPIHDPQQKRDVYQKGVKDENETIERKDYKKADKPKEVQPSGSKKPLEENAEDDDFSDSMYEDSEEEARFETQIGHVKFVFSTQSVLFFPDCFVFLDPPFSIFNLTPFFRQEPPRKVPTITRREQIESKGETSRGRGRARGRNKGRGRGRGGNKSSGSKRKQDDEDYDEKNWFYEESLSKWFWVGDDDDEPSKKKPKRKASPKKPKKTAIPKKTPTPKRESVDSKKKRAASKGDEKEAKKQRTSASSQKPKQPDARTLKRNGRNETIVEPIPDAPMTKKEQKQEILDFILKMKGVSEDDAKSTLKAMLPNYSANGFDCSPDIYWVRKGVKGIGCGVRCQSEGKNVGFFGYRAQCNEWIFALAAAIKSADILVTPMH